MRIECENCSATYTIDDGQLGDQPIGAQCPYCGHVKVVRRDTASIDLGFSAQAPAPNLDLGMDGLSSPGQPSSSLDLGPGQPSSSLDLGSGLDIDPVPASSTAADLGFGAGPGPEMDPFGFGGAEVPGPGLEAGADSAFQLGNGPDPVLPSSSPHVGGNSADVAFSVGPTVSGGEGALGESPVVCQECGTPLHDEFDKVIGLCEVHQQERRGPDTGSVTVHANLPNWHARLPDGAQVGPLPLEHLRERIRGGEIPLGSQFSGDGQRFQPLASFKELAYLASLGVGGQAGLGARASYAPSRRRLDVARLATPVLAALVVLGLGYLAWSQRSDLVRIYANIVSDAEPERPQRPNPLRRYLASWRLAHPDVSGTAREHLRAAEDHHLEDTFEGYQLAERAFQRALLLDESDPEAVAGYIENFAIWRYATASPLEVQIISQTLEHVLDPPPTDPIALAAVKRAAGALAWVSGDLNNCRAGADAALSANPQDERARLILAGCFLEGNVQLAVNEAESVRRAWPALRRADRVLADAYRRGGRFRSAYAVLDARLKSDPRNGAVHLAYGGVDADLARYSRAETRFRRAATLPGDQQAAFQAQGDLALERGQLSKATQAFRRAVKAATPSGRRGADIYTGWALAELRRRAPARAEQLARQALKLRSKYVPAMLVQAEAAFAAGSSTTATAVVRRALTERKEEPAALVLAGRVAMAEGNTEQALQHMRQAVDNAPKDARLYALLASALLRAGRSPQAYATMRKAADLDPARAERAGQEIAFQISDGALLEAVREFQRSARTPRNASVANAAVGLIHLYRGDLAQARAAVNKALGYDEANLLALIYRAQIDLDEKAYTPARNAASKLLAVERGSAIGHLLRARAFTGLKAYERAREDYRAALRTNPGLLSAKVEQASLDITEGSDETAAARKVLEDAFSIEPNLLFLRRLLFEHEIAPG